MDQAKKLMDLEREIKALFIDWANGPRNVKFQAGYVARKLANGSCRSFSARLVKDTPFFRGILVRLGIDPEACINQRFDENSTEYKNRLIAVVRSVSKQVGHANLNDSSMNSKKDIELPSALRKRRGRWTLSEQYKHVPTIALQSLYQRCRRTFGSWDKTLAAAGFSPGSVKRRVPVHSIAQLIRRLDQYDKSKKGKWVIRDLRTDKFNLYHAIHNHGRGTRSSEQWPYLGFARDPMFTAWLTLQYFREKGRLVEDAEWIQRRGVELRQQFEERHRAQEKWSLEKIQKGALSVYAEGGGFGRADLAKTPGGKNLLAAVRSPRWSKGRSEMDVFKHAGVLVKNIDRVERIIADRSLEELRDWLRGLVKKSITEKTNCLSREYVQTHHVGMFFAADRWRRRLTGVKGEFIDWSKTLAFFGLNPGVFEITASKRAKRGYSFQRCIDDVLGAHLRCVDDPREVTGAGVYCHNKSLRCIGCKHKIACKPDFFFQGLIIDAKVGGVGTRKGQMRRYLSHAKVFIVTPNQRHRIEKCGRKSLEIGSVDTLIRESHSLLGTRLRLDGIRKVTDSLTTKFAIVEPLGEQRNDKGG